MGKGKHQPADPPAWPLGCGVALLGFCLGFPIAWLVGGIIAALELAPWLERAGPLIGWLAVPLLLLGGFGLLRRANPYAARILLWGVAFSLLALTVSTALFDLIDRLSGL